MKFPALEPCATVGCTSYVDRDHRPICTLCWRNLSDDERRALARPTHPVFDRQRSGNAPNFASLPAADSPGEGRVAR